MIQRPDSAIEVTLIGGTSGPSGEGDFFTMLEAALDGILEVCGADRGQVLLFEVCAPDHRQLRRAREGFDLSDFAEAEVLVQQARIMGKPVLEIPEQSGPGTPGSTRAALCVPIRQRGGVLGVVYIERSGAAFAPDTLSVLAWFAQMVETELRSRRQRRWRWRTVDVSRQISQRVVA